MLDLLIYLLNAPLHSLAAASTTCSGFGKVVGQSARGEGLARELPYTSVPSHSSNIKARLKQYAAGRLLLRNS